MFGFTSLQFCCFQVTAGAKGAEKVFSFGMSDTDSGADHFDATKVFAAFVPCVRWAQIRSGEDA